MILYDPLISIIMPSFNSAKYIIYAIDSVINQTYTNWELIIIDDFSSDDSISIYIKYKTYEKVRLILLNKNHGAAYCRNLGIKEAKGDFISFLDSDDIWQKDKLEVQLGFMLKHRCDFSLTQYQFIDEDGKQLRKYCNVPYFLNYRRMLFHCFTGCSTVMYDSKKIGLIQGLDVKSNNDYALFLEILKHSQKARGVKAILSYYRIRKGSLTAKKVSTIKTHYLVLRKVANLTPLQASSFIITHNIIKYFYKERYQL